MSDGPRNGSRSRPPGATPITALDPSAARRTPQPGTRTPSPAPMSATRTAGDARYVVDKQIGSGGMGRVFAGRDLRLGRTVAIKMLRTHDAALARRFEREVRLAARLQHPGVVPVYDAGFWASGEPFLVMKLVLGQSLARVVKDADTREDRLALLPDVLAAAEAVAYAHDQGIVHRDLKPSNILLGAFGETVVLDWGLAKDLRAQDPSPDRDRGQMGIQPIGGDTAVGAIVGTPSYMSPEQADGKPVDLRADVYALGAILYFVLSGTAPQPASTNPPGRAPAASGNLVSLGTLEPGLPSDLLAIVAKSIAMDPGRRYPSAFELAEDLKRFASGQLVAARRYSALERVGHFVAHHPVALGLAFAAAAAGMVIARLAMR
jgi:eukaryotic-like serine/threonine-protein kinase